MEILSGMHTQAILSPRAAAGTKEPASVRQPETKADAPQKPLTDEYIPEEKQESAGRYRLGNDGDGNPKILFDDPQQPEAAPKTSSSDETKKADHPEKKASGSPGKSCRANTDKVDREIERLKKKQRELKQPLNTETDPTKAEALKKQLTQIENELRQKDNDSYRRQHTVYTFS